MSRKARPLPPVERLRYLLDYDPQSGVFVWRNPPARSVKVRQVAGAINGNGYVVIQIDGTNYLAHRLAWLHHYGTEPEDEVDHVNGIKSDNRIENLRAASCSQNQANVGKRKDNTTGHKGVSFHKASGKFRALIKFEGKRYHLGYFTDPALAALAHAGAHKLLFGDFSHATINIVINNYHNGDAQQ